MIFCMEIVELGLCGFDIVVGVGVGVGVMVVIVCGVTVWIWVCVGLIWLQSLSCGGDCVWVLLCGFGFVWI